VFFAAIRLNELLVEVFEECLKESRFDTLLGDHLGNSSEWILFSQINGQNQVNGECDLYWGLSHFNTRAVPFLSGISYGFLPIGIGLVLKDSATRPTS